LLIADFLDVSTLSSKSDDDNDDTICCDEYCSVNNVDVVLSDFINELGTVELNCLYNVAGYVVSSIFKKENCSVCSAAVKCSMRPSDMQSDVTQLVFIKEYRAGCLVYCTQLTFDLLLFTEQIFRKSQSQFFTAVGNVAKKLTAQINDTTINFVFPNCHNIKHKIINRYVTVRLHFLR
jgi:hypothetical protein